mgnify:FL=1
MLKVEKVVDSGDKIKKTGQPLYDIYFQNGWKYDKQITRPDDWTVKTKEYIVTTSKLASGEIKRTYKSVDSEKDWIAIKQKAEQDIATSGKMVGEYIYDTLLQKPYQKIRGKLIRTIERKFYKKELERILETQIEFHPELRDCNLYTSCIEGLYPNNEPHRNNIANRDFLYLFVDDIIFYQRPLKSKKYLIDECPLEFREYTAEDGTIKKKGIKCITKSNPLFQEFRLLQWIKNLRIYRKDERQEVDVTEELLPTIADRELLFEWLNEKPNIDQKAFLKYKPFELEEKIKKMLGNEGYSIFKKDKERGLHTYYRWNYVEDKSYQLNETRGGILSYLKKAEIDPDFLDSETEMHLWHILYSVEDSEEITKALIKFANKHSLPESFIESFKKYPRIKKEYGSYSVKAIKKLLPLMRFGKWWNWDTIDSDTRTRIDKLLTGEYDEKIRYRVREKAINLQKEEDFQDLPLWLTSYIIYDRHSESSTLNYWKEANDITLLKQHSLRNPIVEMVVNETLQTVKDIWKYYGEGKENFFDEIHVELGREMKNPKEQREKISKRIAENEKTNIRMKSLLVELFNDGETENVRPYSPIQQEMLKIYEEGIYLNPDSVYSTVSEAEIDSIRKKNTPTPSDLKRYKLWLEQGYKSPYTGEIIPLSKLFTPAYEIEHIIPQTRFFDDSFSNKVICEAEVNSLKGNQLAYEFITNNKELKIELNYGKSVTLLHPEVYERNVKRYFGNNKTKMNKLLLEEIPDKFIERQMNDTRYISKTITSLLSNIVREESEQESISKNVIPTSGKVTSSLKRDWGLNDVWNELITPRFVRLNHMAGFEKYGSWENKEGKRVFQINTMEPELYQLEKKRIDHRHHALDALVVACSTRDHINYLNNINANGKDKDKPLRYDLREKLRRTEEIEVKKAVNGEVVRKKMRVAKEFYKPWNTFTKEAKEHLNKMVVSFKKNNRVINKTVNHYQKWVEQSDGTMKKMFVKQVKGDHWAIRKPLHKETISALVNLQDKKQVSLRAALSNVDNITNRSLRKKVRELADMGYNTNKIISFFNNLNFEWQGENIEKVDIFFYTNDQESTKVAASRVDLDDSFTENIIEKITDSGIRKILLAHIESYKYIVDEQGKPVSAEKLAFSPEGIEKLNCNIVELNGGKKHTPIYKVRTFEKFGNKFNVGNEGNNKFKYVEAAKGTNLFFAIYEDDKRVRSYETIPLNIVIERQKQGLPSCPENNEQGNRLLFSLSPNDLVYVPTPEEQDNPKTVDFSDLSKEQVKRVYKFVSCTGNRAYFINSTVATTIVNKYEFSALNKIEKCDDDVQIKSTCWKLEIDRLGNIKRVTT